MIKKINPPFYICVVRGDLVDSVDSDYILVGTYNNLKITIYIYK